MQTRGKKYKVPDLPGGNTAMYEWILYRLVASTCEKVVQAPYRVAQLFHKSYFEDNVIKFDLDDVLCGNELIPHRLNQDDLDDCAVMLEVFKPQRMYREPYGPLVLMNLLSMWSGIVEVWLLIFFGALVFRLWVYHGADVASKYFHNILGMSVFIF